MPLVTHRPITPGQRFLVRVKTEGLHTGRPERALTESNHRARGRNCYGRITSRRRGGGHKKLYRTVDFRRDRIDEVATVLRIEYDPNRTSHLALLEYADKTLSYILAPDGLKVGDKVVSTNTAQEQLVPGLSLPLRLIAPATFIHCVEIEPGRGAQIARSAGGFAQLLGIEDGRAILRLPSGEQRYIHAECRATVGIVGNVDHHNASLGKAGRNRWKGRRPRVRGIAMNPVDHPNGGGGGKSKGGGGRQHLKSPWSQLAKGFPTRTKSKASNNQIIVRRNGRKVKQV
ncbi:MAG: 50S ribosomal protein L2 [Verrucomicrobia bacterium]|nr:50S ribosomal protein L2 [Verrucomicrobiota bacterium]NBS03746.1 50S ribosomal protein L2 [Verrucomicrobiota bacterium]NBY36519.1 50S ribosomal protein L2 [Verrucomicrobiota bacterium]